MEQGIGLDQLIGELKASRRYFLRHLDGLPEEAWTFKPYPQCKSIVETLGDLIIDDKCALDLLETHREPNYDAYDDIYKETDPRKLLVTLGQTHVRLVDFIRLQYAGMPLDTSVFVWHEFKPLALAIPHFCTEDYYHAGQVAFIRMAVQPDWDYYAAIYGM